jgi:hypothetical protein
MGFILLIGFVFLIKKMKTIALSIALILAGFCGHAHMRRWLEALSLFPYICTYMAKEKNKPVPVRFDLKLLEILKEEEKIDTPQQALNFLSKFWENNRPATGDFTSDLKEIKTPAPIPKTKERETATHPSGLSGIDLSIWKAEQKEKSKNA